MHHSSVSWEICLLYFFSWNFIWFLQKERTKVQNVWLVESYISPNLYFDRLLFWKYVKFQLKRYIQGGYVSWYWRVVQNLKINWFLVSKMPRLWWILIWALKSLKKLHFDWSPWCKVYNVWPKKVQRSYILRHRRVMQSLKKKLACGLENDMKWQIFIRTLESVKIGTLMGFFCPK